jgi:hypothetical protein
MQLSPHPEQAGSGTGSAQTVERRRHPRNNPPVPVKVYVQRSGQDVEFQAVLVNSSRGGLAIRHSKKLSLGTHIKACFASGEQLVARVKWNWISGPVVISGLERVPEGELDRIPVQRFRNIRRFARHASVVLATAALTALVIVVGLYLKARLF